MSHVIRSIRVYYPHLSPDDGPTAAAGQVSLVQYDSGVLLQTPYAIFPGNAAWDEEDMRRVAGMSRGLCFDTEAEAAEECRRLYPHWSHEANRAVRDRYHELLRWENPADARYRLAEELGHYLMPVAEWIKGTTRVPSNIAKKMQAEPAAEDPERWDGLG